MTPVSRPPLFLVVGSVEYFLATAAQLWPELSAFLAAVASAWFLASTTRMLRDSCVPNCEAWLL